MGRETLVRRIGPSPEELAVVAARMKLTLMEVLGEEQGAAMYTDEWLQDRVRFHLDGRCTGDVFVAVAPDGHLAGHTIVRLEPDEQGRLFGLFSTTYVEPESRRSGVANALLVRGEEWMRGQRAPVAKTYTSESNEKLIKLYERHGYAITERHPGKKMIVLEKQLGS